MVRKFRVLRTAVVAVLATSLFAISCGGADDDEVSPDKEGEIQLTVEAAAEQPGHARRRGGDDAAPVAVL